MFTIAVVSENFDYKERFEKEEDFKQVLNFDKPSFEANVELDAIFIDGKTISYRELPNVRSLHGNIPIFYKLSEVPSNAVTKNINLVCRGHEITPISENYNTEQDVNEVIKSLTGKEDTSSNRVISFFGTHSGAGTSSIVFNVARALGQYAKEKVLVLSLNPWDSSDYFLQQYDGSYLNDLKLDLKTKNLNEEKLRKSVHKTQYYSHLAGNRDIKLQRYYHTDEISDLIEVSKATYDVVLIDGGSHFDNACYAQAFISSDLKYLVATQEEKGYRNYFPLVLQQLLEPIGASPDDFILLLNKFHANYSLISEKDLQEDLEMSLLTSIPDQDILGVLAIRQGELLFDIGSEDYQRAIQTIVNTIISESGLTRDETEMPIQEKKGILDMIFKKKKPEKIGEKI